VGDLSVRRRAAATAARTAGRPGGAAARRGRRRLRRCERGDEGAVWSDDTWVLAAPEPNGLPIVVLLEPRAHYAEPGDLPDELAAELGVMLARVERAVRSVGEIGRVHVCRWGDGGEHLHWWFMARPARIPQLIGSFAAVWDDILPPTPEDVWRANLAAVRTYLSAEHG